MYGTQRSRATDKAFVLQHAGDIHTVGDISTLAKVAEAAGIETTGANGDMAALMEEIRQSRAEVRMLTNRLDRMSLNTVGSRSPTPERRRVRFQTSTYAGGRGALRQGTSRRMPATTTNRGSCERCGRGHYGFRPATNMNCYNCSRRGHLSARCRMGHRWGRRASP